MHGISVCTPHYFMLSVDKQNTKMEIRNKDDTAVLLFLDMLLFHFIICSFQQPCMHTLHRSIDTISKWFHFLQIFVRRISSLLCILSLFYEITVHSSSFFSGLFQFISSTWYSTILQQHKGKNQDITNKNKTERYVLE